MNTDNNSFDPTSNLKSRPAPVLFIPFKNNEKKCNYCGIKYSETLKLRQKYCKNCLFWYIQYTSDNNTYLDVQLSSNNSQCIKHKATRNNFYTTNIQEWCEYCSEILYFTQVVTKNSNCWHINDKYYEFCNHKKKRSSVYQASSGWVESTLTKKSIPILYLPWWDIHKYCVVCNKELKYIHQGSKSYCQKWCSRCFTIYSGCRYCLTTNIIFGIADQSQCKKCKRTSFINIDITNICSGNFIIDEFLDFTRISNNKILQNIASKYLNNRTMRCPIEIYMFIGCKLEEVIEWIPYSQITNFKKIAEGGFSIIYKATWKGSDVAVKKLRDSQYISKHFLNELKSLYQCKGYRVIDCYGITQDPITKEYMLILNYAKGISFGLKNIHDNNFIHRDIHSGNMLLSTFWKVGDLGLSQPANNILSNNEIYGVIPYIAPEIFKGAAFSKESDIYSLGVIMWEFTTGCKPFTNVEHDHNLIFKILDGERPKITEDTPECYADLMKKCWDSNPSKRPTIYEIWKLGPEFSEKSHPKAIYTSRALSSLISKASTISSMVSFNMKQEYITQEYEFDIDNIQRSSTQNTNSATLVFRTNRFVTRWQRDLSIKKKIIEFGSLDPEIIIFGSRIESESSPNRIEFQRRNLIRAEHYATQSLIIPVNSSRKRNFEELKNETNETQKNRKYIKADNSDDELLNIIELI
ncbi:kinase-like domain-containing protein [Rhizophagus diaphanus]|nr:kinase-like domain-containing protein [Rhizophagus diaphanus] [Rhizophagus sp. MUCL 43196]